MLRTRTDLTGLQRARTPLAVALALVVAVGVFVLSPDSSAKAEEGAQVIDGATQQTAAASCWEVKQLHPSAPDGLYWLRTPTLVAPEQFFCDMTSEGGGWVLVGRGREGWSYGGDGSGSARTLREKPNGPEAFPVRQLSNDTIDGLLDGGRVDALADGVRIRRALYADGSAMQEVRFGLRARDRWSWAFGAGHPLSWYSVDGATSSALATTRDIFPGNDRLRIWTYESSGNGWNVGFNYGFSVKGLSSPTSYLYSSLSTGNYATPFAQVWLRPQLSTADLTYPSVTDEGTAKSTILALASARALPGQWGVTGLGAGGSGELAAEVSALAQIGDIVYVGGNFTTVQRGPSPATENYPQAYLAAFDAATGDWISTFRPQLNNQVKSLAALPNGNLAVGGEFTEVNDQDQRGLVILNGDSGVATPNQVTIENRLSDGLVNVRALETSGDWLYLGGKFTHLKGGTSTAQYSRNAARVKASDGTVDWRWNPVLNGVAADLDVSDDGSRVYLAGYFTAAQGESVISAVALSTANGAPIVQPRWYPTLSQGTTPAYSYQQAVAEAEDRVWLGGSQHSMFGYNRSTFALTDTTITRSGGDLQAAEATDDVVYGGCHCGDWAYLGTTNYVGTTPGDPYATWTQGDEINFVGAWNSHDGAYLPQFTPITKARQSLGAWALMEAADGTLWAGGSFTSAATTTGRNQWVGGFVRFPIRDHVAPASPSGLRAVLDGSTASLTWAASPSEGVVYEVLRDGVVVAVTSATQVRLDDSTASDRFFVRARDDAGNRSASTRVAVVEQTVISSGSSWAYSFNTEPQDPTWQQRDFADQDWSSGPAPLGFGGTTVATNIDVAAGQTRPLTSYHRHAFTVEDPSSIAQLNLSTRADDGIVVYLNGTEVGRSNMPAGGVSPNTYALKAVSEKSALANPVRFQVDPGLLVAGENIVAVEVHSGYRTTPDTSMDLVLTSQ